MAATATMDTSEIELSPDKEHTLHKQNNSASHIQTPPASDGSSRGHKDDDAASSSSLSDLEDDMEPDARFEDNIAGAGAGAGAGSGVQDDGRFEIKPDRYEGGIPIFTPVRGSSTAHSTSTRSIQSIVQPCFPSGSCTLSADITHHTDHGTVQGLRGLRQRCQFVWHAVGHCLDRSTRRMVRIPLVNIIS